MKHSEKLLICVAEKVPALPSELSAKTGINPSNVVVYLKRLMTEGFVDKIKRGEYQITTKGKDRVKNLLQESNQENIEQSAEDSIKGVNLEDINVLLKLKQMYGKKRLLKILENIKKVIE